MSSEAASAARRYRQARELAEDLGLTPGTIDSLTKDELYARIKSRGWFWTGHMWVAISADWGRPWPTLPVVPT